MSESNIEIVQALYEKFRSGDIAAVIEMLSNDVHWDHRGPPGVPFYRLYEGRPAVTEFFRTLASVEDPLVFEPREFFGNDDRVVVLGFSRWRVKSTQREWETDWAHVLTLRHGLVASWKPILNMAAEMHAFGH